VRIVFAGVNLRGQGPFVVEMRGKISGVPPRVAHWPHWDEATKRTSGPSEPSVVEEENILDV